jgi:RNA polymerase sigma-70 factor (ECF subfamily)
VLDSRQLARFQDLILPHLDAAYNLARWLTRKDEDAADVVQEAYLRAIRFFDSFHGPDGRVWLLTIVRNTYYNWSKQNRVQRSATSFDEELHSAAQEDLDPERLAQLAENRQRLHQALDELPTEYREILVLRELEGLSYKEIAEVAGLPIGTVMSRLARGRGRLQQQLATFMNKEL